MSEEPLRSTGGARPPEAGGPQHGVLVDRSGGKAWRTPAGDSLLPPDEWELTVVTDRWPGGAPPPGTRVVPIGDLTEAGVRGAVQTIAAARRIDRISTTSEYFLTTVAAIREELGLPGKTLPYTRRVRDKWLMKQRAQQLSVPCAPGTCASHLDQWPGSTRAAHGYVVKPRAESGSRGVTVVREWRDVVELVASLPDPAAYLVEEFNPGPVLHVDGMVVGTEMLLQVSRYTRPCHTTGGRVPLSSSTVDDPAVIGRVSALMARITAGWPIEDDTFHCELFQSPSRLSLCELAARPGGAGVVDVFRATRGIDLRHAKTLLDLGLDPRPLAAGPPTAAHGGWTVVYAPSPGPAQVDDSGVVGHRTREVFPPSGPPVRDIAGVGIATYTFAAQRAQEVLRLIDTYERGVRVVPVDRDDPPAAARPTGSDERGGSS